MLSSPLRMWGMYTTYLQTLLFPFSVPCPQQVRTVSIPGVRITVLVLSGLAPPSHSPSSEQHSVHFRVDAHSEDRVCQAIARAKHSPAWARQGIQVCWACPVAGTSGAAWLAFLSESGRPLKRIRERLEGSPGPGAHTPSQCSGRTCKLNHGETQRGICPKGCGVSEDSEILNCFYYG